MSRFFIGEICVEKGVGVTAFLLKNEPTSMIYVAWLTPCAGEAAVKASLNRALVAYT